MIAALVLEVAAGALAAATCAYLGLALWHTLRFRPRHRAGPGPRPPVSVMVPVHGAPPGLEECLRAVYAQDYPEMQVVFGLHSADDPGRACIERVMAEHPGVESAVVIDERRVGANPKVCNLANMYRAVRHELIVVIDSDVEVEPGFLGLMAEALQAPGVGAATCFYRALSQPGFASALGATVINEWLLPSALVDVALHEGPVCYGAAIGLTRAAHEATGGFEARADAVAEDDALAALMGTAGYRVAVVPHVVATVIAERDLRTLWYHELRWMRTVRACRPRDHALALVMYTLPSVVLLLGPARSAPGLALLGAVIVLRLALHYAVRARFAAPSPVWLVPLRECFGFAVWVASFASRTMRWGDRVIRGEQMRTIRTGRGGAA